MSTEEGAEPGVIADVLKNWAGSDFRLTPATGELESPLANIRRCVLRHRLVAWWSRHPWWRDLYREQCAETYG